MFLFSFFPQNSTWRSKLLKKKNKKISSTSRCYISLELSDKISASSLDSVSQTFVINTVLSLAENVIEVVHLAQLLQTLGTDGQKYSCITVSAVSTCIYDELPFAGRL